MRAAPHCRTMQTERSLQSKQTKLAECRRSLQFTQAKLAACERAPPPLGMIFGFIDMNLIQAFHALTRIAATTHGGRPSDYNTPITWQCASNAVRMQRDLEALMHAHKECGRLRVAIAAARMVYAMRSAAVR